MRDLLTGKTMQRLVSISAIFAILSTAGIGFEDSRFWCVVVLILVIEYIAHYNGMQEATSNLLSMQRGKLIKLKDFIDNVANGGEHSVDELIQLLKEQEKHDE